MSKSAPADALPTALRRLPFFYGWVIVGLAMLSAFLAAGMNNVSMSVVFKPLSDDLGWSRTLMAGAIAVGSIVGGFLGPWAGGLADRFGPRLLLPLGALVAGAAFGLIGLIEEPWQFYALYVPARAISETTLLGVVPLTAVANWFHFQRPRAMGLIMMAIPLGSAAIAPLYQVLILAFGWRAVFVIMGALIWLLLVVPGWVLLRRQPEDVGLLPDGRGAPRGERPWLGTTAAGRAPADEYSWTLGEAARTSALWLIVVSIGLNTLGTGGVAFNLAAYLTDVDVDPTVAAGAVSVFALAGAVGNMAWGMLGERHSIRLLTVAAMLGSVLATLILLQVRTPLVAFAFAVLFGLTARGSSVLDQVMIARYFGRRSFGAISGLTDPFIKGGLGLGPLVAAAAFDLTGSYQGPFLVFAVAFGISALLIFLARRPTPPPRPTPLPTAA